MEPTMVASTRISSVSSNAESLSATGEHTLRITPGEFEVVIFAQAIMVTARVTE